MCTYVKPSKSEWSSSRDKTGLEGLLCTKLAGSSVPRRARRRRAPCVAQRAEPEKHRSSDAEVHDSQMVLPSVEQTCSVLLTKCSNKIRCTAARKPSRT